MPIPSALAQPVLRGQSLPETMQNHPTLGQGFAIFDPTFREIVGWLIIDGTHRDYRCIYRDREIGYGMRDTIERAYWADVDTQMFNTPEPDWECSECHRELTQQQCDDCYAAVGDYRLCTDHLEQRLAHDEDDAERASRPHNPPRRPPHGGTDLFRSARAATRIQWNPQVVGVRSTGTQTYQTYANNGQWQYVSGASTHVWPQNTEVTFIEDNPTQEREQ